jgi:hypothetical protein
MGRRKYYGTCRICGGYSKLSFEHVPPEAAFNDKAVVQATIEELERADFDYAKVRGRIQQRGRGAYTLCDKCNSDTGSWYGGAFVEWAAQALRVLHLRLDSPQIYIPFFIFPLRVIKQILCMFASQDDGLAYRSHPSLRRFLLDPQSSDFDPDLRVFMYLNVGRLFRSLGITAVGDLEHHTTNLMSETSFPPFGYVLTIRSPPPDRRLVEITHFTCYKYREWKGIWLRIPFLPVNTWVPGDYRTLEEVLRDVERNRAAANTAE